jgi:DEAD/DEAH box helicase domain-containing protein
LSRHLLCAGAEGGRKATEVTQYFGNKSDLIVGELLKQHQLFWSREQILWRRGYPHGDVSLRGIQDQNIELIDVKTSEVLEEMSLELAYRECYPGAIYLTSSEGKTLTWRCLELDAENAKAKLKLGDLEDKRTIPFVQLNIKTTTNLETPKIITTPKGNLRLSFWWGTIGNQVSGYQETLLIYAPTCINRQCSYYYVPQTPQATNCPKCKRQLKKLLSTKVIDDVTFDQSLETNYEAPILGIEVNDILAKEIINYHQQIKQSLRTIYGNPDNIPHQIATVFDCEPVYLTLHSLSHLLIKTVPLLFLASHQDLSSFTVERPVKWDNPHRTLVYIFDSVHEGCGTTEALVNDWDACVQKALELASNCDCGDLGCPRCLTEYGCPESNEALSKLSGMWLLEQIANGTFS